MKKFLKWLGIENAFKQGLIARILTILCLVFIVFGVVFVTIRIVMTLLPNYPPAHWTDLLIESLILVVGLISLWYIRSDKMQTASRVLLGGMLIAVTMQAYFLGDPANDIAGAMGLQLFAILAILLLDRRDRWIAILLVVCIFIGLNVLSTSGFLLPVIDLTPAGKTLFSFFVWLAVSIIIVVVLISAMGAIRREPQLLQQQFNYSAQNNSIQNPQHNLTHLSTHDALTGLYNRLFFETEFTRLDKSRLFPISIIVAKVDDLIKINETFGDRASDQHIISIALLFTKVFREADIISRLSEDEFVILLPSSDAAIVNIVIGRINKQIEAFNKEHSDNLIHISMGISTAEQSNSLKEHLKVAEKLMQKEIFNKRKKS